MWGLNVKTSTPHGRLDTNLVIVCPKSPVSVSRSGQGGVVGAHALGTFDTRFDRFDRFDRVDSFDRFDGFDCRFDNFDRTDRVAAAYRGKMAQNFCKTDVLEQKFLHLRRAVKGLRRI